MIHQTEVDGVPTLLAPRQGPLSAGLVFRVGMADETLARGGITHMVEHLALHRHGLTDYHFNGATTMVHTHFHMEGSERDIVAFLSGVCESLLDLPVDRLETEKEILRTEEAGRGRSAREDLALWRYGAQGYGLAAYPELGLAQLSREDVRHWAETWFTRENAALWIAGDRIPPQLRLRLRAGSRRGLPRASSTLPVTPAYFSAGSGAVLLESVVRRSTPAMLTAKVLGRELFRGLRQQGGYSYTATAVYESRGDGSATITALADALPDKQDAVLGGFVDVLAKLSAGRIESADLEAVRAKAVDSLMLPDADADRLQSQAADLLAGHPVTASEGLRAELSAVGSADVHLVVKEMMGSALLQVPQGRDADWAGYSPAPTHSVSIVAGTQYPARKQGESAVVIGADGASLVTKSGARTVRFEECVAKLMWPDGARELIGADAIAVRIEPTLFAIDPVALAFVDSRVHPSRVVWMPARRPESIPQPPTGTPAAARTANSGPVAPRGRFETLKLIVWTVSATIWGLIMLLMILVAATDETSSWTDATMWVVIAIVVFPEVLLVWLIVKNLRRRRPARV